MTKEASEALEFFVQMEQRLAETIEKVRKSRDATQQHYPNDANAEGVEGTFLPEEERSQFEGELEAEGEELEDESDGFEVSLSDFLQIQGLSHGVADARRKYVILDDKLYARNHV